MVLEGAKMIINLMSIRGKIKTQLINLQNLSVSKEDITDGCVAHLANVDVADKEVMHGTMSPPDRQLISVSDRLTDVLLA